MNKEIYLKVSESKMNPPRSISALKGCKNKKI
jgi:hypothetical protein